MRQPAESKLVGLMPALVAGALGAGVLMWLLTGALWQFVPVVLAIAVACQVAANMPDGG